MTNSERGTKTKPRQLKIVEFCTGETVDIQGTEYVRSGDPVLRPSGELVIILKVYIDEDEQKSIDVPITPESTFGDVLECVREPGKSDSHIGELWRGRERAVGNDEIPFDVLQNWGKLQEEVAFFLRQGPPPESEDESFTEETSTTEDSKAFVFSLPGGMDMTLTELQDMASRQQQQIESQQQVLVAKEQRLKFLKQQEQKQQQFYSENDKLRRLRDRVETQELKLKKLRALRGEVEKHKNSNGVLNSELESIKALFNEKEKELSLAVAKVEALTHQLEEIRQGKLNLSTGDSSHHVAQLELEKLRKELMLRNKMNVQQKSKFIAQQEKLKQRKNENKYLDTRIHELQMRLKKKRAQQGDAKTLGGKRVHANTNIAAVEPYVQHPPKEQVENEQPEKTQFEKQDPKYQTLPPNTKFPLPENKQKDENQNTKQSVYENEKKHVKIPVVSSQNIVSNQTFVNGNSSDQQPKKVSVSSAPEQRYSHVPPIPPRTGMNGITHLAPRPFGTTYSTSLLAPRTVTSVQHPVISIQDDIRQAGSGQSSPASSDSSNKEGVPKNNVAGVTRNVQSSSEQVTSFRNMISAQAQENEGTNSPLSSQSTGHRQYANQNDSSKNISSGAPSSHSHSYNNSNKGNEDSDIPKTASNSYENDTEIFHGNMQAKSDSANSNSSESTEGNQRGIMWNKGHQYSANENGSNISSQYSANGGQSNKPNFSFGGYSSSQGPVLQKQPLRYASKSVIENTYMGKMGSDSFEKYQKSLNMLKMNLESVNSVKQTSGSDQRENFPPESQINQQPTQPGVISPSGSSTSSKSPTSPNRPDHRHHHHFIIPGSPQHPDIASDKVSYKAHTPKQLRRRHSDSDNEDIGRILHKYMDRKMSSNSDNKVGVVNNDNNSSTDTQATSFANHIPERVYIDNMGNMVDGNESNQLLPVPENTEQNSSSITVISSPTEGSAAKKKTILKGSQSKKNKNRVSFDPLALLLDASLEGELELVMRCAREVPNVSESNDEGITALHNAICAGHVDIVKFLVEFGCDVNSPDSDGWTPLHCAASCNNIAMVKFLVEHGACIFATTISDHETAAEKCEEDEDGYDGCSEYLYSIQEKLGIMNNGVVFAVFDYSSQNQDELNLQIGDRVEILRKGDENEMEWWWAKLGEDGYVPRNLLGLYPRVLPNNNLKDLKSPR
ncbi:hypothetical protein ScPMuIL_014825 [Solemya velum]